jgi:hypothetical protein
MREISLPIFPPEIQAQILVYLTYNIHDLRYFSYVCPPLVAQYYNTHPIYFIVDKDALPFLHGRKLRRLGVYNDTDLSHFDISETVKCPDGRYHFEYLSHRHISDKRIVTIQRGGSNTRADSDVTSVCTYDKISIKNMPLGLTHLTCKSMTFWPHLKNLTNLKYLDIRELPKAPIPAHVEELRLEVPLKYRHGLIDLTSVKSASMMISSRPTLTLRFADTLTKLHLHNLDTKAEQSTKLDITPYPNLVELGGYSSMFNFNVEAMSRIRKLHLDVDCDVDFSFLTNIEDVYVTHSKRGTVVKTSTIISPHLCEFKVGYYTKIDGIPKYTDKIRTLRTEFVEHYVGGEREWPSLVDLTAENSKLISNIIAAPKLTTLDAHCSDEDFRLPRFPVLDTICINISNVSIDPEQVEEQPLLKHLTITSSRDKTALAAKLFGPNVRYSEWEGEYYDEEWSAEENGFVYTTIWTVG